MASVTIGEHIVGHVADIQRRLETGNYGADSLDYITFRLDWLINVLVRYTCDVNETNLPRVINLLREVKDILTSQCSGTCTNYCSERIFTGMNGRPKFNIPKEQLEFFIEQGFTVPAIAEILGVSSQTVERRLQQYNLHLRTAYSTLSDHDLDTVINGILVDFPETGYKRMTGFLKARGIVLQQSRIREAMRRINPEGTLLRALRLHAINRRSYQVVSPLALWHIDGNHKLIRYTLLLEQHSPHLVLGLFGICNWQRRGQDFWAGWGAAKAWVTPGPLIFMK